MLPKCVVRPGFAGRGRGDSGKLTFAQECRVDIMERSRAVFLPRSPAVPQARRRFRLRPIATWLSAALAAAALAGTPPQPARAAPQSMSAQQLFDAAGQAAMDGHCGDALPPSTR
ncbi:MAG: hypothetical protein U1F11_10520 [Steroidobacteraceae bacterium]